eukprot:6721210-Lingulodinium_polyedra.AAC.1
MPTFQRTVMSSGMFAPSTRSARWANAAMPPGRRPTATNNEFLAPLGPSEAPGAAWVLLGRCSGAAW